MPELLGTESVRQLLLVADAQEQAKVTEEDDSAAPPGDVYVSELQDGGAKPLLQRRTRAAGLTADSTLSYHRNVRLPRRFHMASKSKSIIVGTAGHIDHGKSTLIEALTGTHPDRLEEEKRRGITIDLGFAFLEGAGVRFGFVDVPGHERFVKNMLAGASGVDLVLLVISADQAMKPQAPAHF